VPTVVVTTVSRAAIQVQGGIGNTWDCLAHLYPRRALLSGDVLGDTGAKLARVLDHQRNLVPNRILGLPTP
jgi:hypothetical protein